MMKRTHMFVGAAVTLSLINYSNIILFPIALAGSVAADWDYVLGIKHRTITHTLLALVVSSTILSLFSLQLGLLWGLNYSTHLILDSLTVTGIPLFYPYRKKYYGYKLFKTRGVEDGFILLVALFIVFTFLGF